MVCVVARTVGGMRAGDIDAWNWTMIDRKDFATCTVPRSKTGTPQALVVPEALRQYLRAWWERSAKPSAGPVFPVRAGKGVGWGRRDVWARTRGDFAPVFKRGVFRLDPHEETRELRTGRGTNTRTVVELGPDPAYRLATRRRRRYRWTSTPDDVPSTRRWLKLASTRSTPCISPLTRMRRCTRGTS